MVLIGSEVLCPVEGDVHMECSHQGGHQFFQCNCVHGSGTGGEGGAMNRFRCYLGTQTAPQFQ